MPDPIWDDQAMVIRVATGLVILLGCSHSGVVNALVYIRGLGYTDPIRALVGGMHLHAASDHQLRLTVQALDEHDVAMVVPLHCTGFRASCYMAAHLRERFVAGQVGSTLLF